MANEREIRDIMLDALVNSDVAQGISIANGTGAVRAIFEALKQHGLLRMPERDQEALAGLILAELEADEGWNARFAQTQDQLGELVRRARQEAETEGTLPYDPSNRPQR